MEGFKLPKDKLIMKKKGFKAQTKTRTRKIMKVGMMFLLFEAKNMRKS